MDSKHYLTTPISAIFALLEERVTILVLTQDRKNGQVSTLAFRYRGVVTEPV